MNEPQVDEPIALVEYDSTWPALFEAETARIRPAVAAVATRLEHVGSTAVPGLMGKPVVDILVGVRTLDEGRACTPDLVALGYEDFGEVFVPGRLYLRRRARHHFNIAVTEERGPFFQTQLAVREYLRAHPEAAMAYAAAKRDAWARGARLFSTYSREKHPFVRALMDDALAWSESSR